jgi:serine/threonine protein kinase
MDEAAVRRLGAALAEALQAIHSCGLVHRDLKPANIVMAADGPRVLDFGIARAVEDSRLTVTGTSVGTPGFLAPEQAEGRAVDGAADVFALGAVLAAASGGTPFGQGTPVMLMYRSVHQEPDLTAVSPSLRPVVEACLAKDPARRPTTEQLLDAFGTGSAQAPVYTPTALSVPAVPSPPAYAPTVTAPVTPSAQQGPEEAEEFLAMDHRNAVVADAQGISLGVNGRPLDFPWPLVREVTRAETGRGWGLTVTVLLTNGAKHSCRVVTDDEDELDALIEDLDSVVARHCPTT